MQSLECLKLIIVVPPGFVLWYRPEHNGKETENVPAIEEAIKKMGSNLR